MTYANLLVIYLKCGPFNNIFNRKDNKMDTTKWKSVAVRSDDYETIRKLAKKTYRAPGGTISFLLHEYKKNNQF